MEPELLIPEPHKAIIKRKKKKQRKDVKDKEQHMEEGKFSEYSRKHGESGQRTDTDDSSQVQIPV